MAVNLKESADFNHVDLQDSFILGWQYSAKQLVFDVEFSLWPNHPDYVLPKPGEYTCYRAGQLIFRNVQSITGLRPMAAAVSTIDPNGSKDYGAFDSVGWNENGTAWVIGDFGQIKMYSAPPVYRFERSLGNIVE